MSFDTLSSALFVCPHSFIIKRSRWCFTGQKHFDPFSSAAVVPHLPCQLSRWEPRPARHVRPCTRIREFAGAQRRKPFTVRQHQHDLAAYRTSLKMGVYPVRPEFPERDPRLPPPFPINDLDAGNIIHDTLQRACSISREPILFSGSHASPEPPQPSRGLSGSAGRAGYI